MPTLPGGQAPYGHPAPPPPYGHPPPPPSPYGDPAPPAPPYGHPSQPPSPYGHPPPPPYSHPAPPPPDLRQRHAYPPPQWQPQRSRSSGAGAIVGGFLGVFALVFLGLVVMGAVAKNSRRSVSVSPVAISPPPTSLDGRPTAKPARTASSEPRRTTTSSDASKDTVTPPTRARALNTSLEKNTLYRVGGLPRVNCPAGSASIYSHSQLKALILKTSRCMDKGWSRIMREQGMDWRPPGYALTATKGRGACGDFPSPGSMVPYYCPRNTTIYASTRAMVRGVGNSGGYGSITDWHGGVVSMMAHEYGHHVQHLSGLSDTWWQKSLRSGSQSGRLALSRRFELQATCFGAMFMRSVSASYPVTPARRNTLYYFYSRVGDWPGYPRDHGSPANNHRWFRQGYEKNKTFQCNTWLAPSSATS
ncbi:neutral zinc metallopeptidase [Streptosporangium sp. NPDC000095]|uniref:neutral zinc metallopeptidase n=1 Tax=Streptosporangium sp. NPDC000095 TaxID=3366184 RepID=UPI0036C0FCA0